MKKSFGTLIAMCLFVAGSASAQPGKDPNSGDSFVSEANRVECEKSALGAKWLRKAAPQCLCPEGFYNMGVPNYDKSIKKPVFAALDRCINKDPDKRPGAQPDKPKAEKPAAPTPLPVCSAKFGTVKSNVDEPASNDIECNGSVSTIERMSVSCNNCRPPKSKDIAVAKKMRTYTETVVVRYMDSEQKNSVVTVTFFTSKGSVETQYEVIWVPKTPVAAPAPPPPPAPTPCVKSQGIDTVTQTSEKGCACLPLLDGRERMAVNGVCVEKPAVVEDEWEGQLHMYTKLFAGYGGSSIFRTPFYGFVAGLSCDLHPMVKAYGGVGFSLPGAKLEATESRPTMNRDYSYNAEGGMMFLPIPEIEFSGGAWYRATGWNGASPIRNLIAGTLGIAYSPPVDGVRLSIGPEVYVGADKQGGVSARAFFGGGITLKAEWFGEPDRRKNKK